MPKAHSESRSLWRGVEPLLVRDGMEAVKTRDRAPATVTGLQDVRDAVRDEDMADLVVGVELVGAVYGTQDAVVTATIREEMPFRLAALMDSDPAVADTVVTAAELTMDAAVGLGRLAGNLHEAAGGEYAFVPAATEAALAGLTEPFKKWLLRVRPGTDLLQLRDQWFGSVERHLREHGRILVNGAGPVAAVGREDADGRLHSAPTAWATFVRGLHKALDGEGRRSRRAAETEPAQPRGQA